MKKTDMELQAIREKLLSLQANPKESEVLSSPWAAPRSKAVFYHPSGSRDRSA